MKTCTNSKKLSVSALLRYYFKTRKKAIKILYDKKLLSKNNSIPSLKWCLTILAPLSRIHLRVRILSNVALMDIA